MIACLQTLVSPTAIVLDRLIQSFSSDGDEGCLPSKGRALTGILTRLQQASPFSSRLL
jgi:hypothetical protein